MPMIPQDMDKCRARTIKERGERMVMQKEFRARQKRIRDELAQIARENPYMDVFLCTR